METVYSNLGRCMWLAMAVVTGCAAKQGVRPLDVALFVDRAAVEPALREHSFCRKSQVVRRREVYERCKSPGLQDSDAWIDVKFHRDGRLIELRRTERFVDVKTATGRWHDLVQLRVDRHGHGSDEAKHLTAEVNRIPAGTTAWRSWYRQDRTVIVSLYLVKSVDDQAPRVVEELFPTPDL